MKSSFRKTHPVFCRAASALLLTTCITLLTGCGVGVQYSMSGSTTEAESISVVEFYNNADLGPATMSQTFTNDLKNYFLQNSSLRVVPEEGQLQLEGEIMDYKLTPIAPTSTGDPNDLTSASLTRLTITVKVTYINTLEEKLSFKDKRFSFYDDFPNDANLADIEEQLLKRIFNRIITDIFNASVANW